MFFYNAGASFVAEAMFVVMYGSFYARVTNLFRGNRPLPPGLGNSWFLSAVLMAIKSRILYLLLAPILSGLQLAAFPTSIVITALYYPSLLTYEYTPAINVPALAFAYAATITLEHALVEFGLILGRHDFNLNRAKKSVYSFVFGQKQEHKHVLDSALSSKELSSINRINPTIPQAREISSSLSTTPPSSFPLVLSKQMIEKPSASPLPKMPTKEDYDNYTSKHGKIDFVWRETSPEEAIWRHNRGYSHR